MGASIDELISELREPARALVDLASRAGVMPRITSTRRSRGRQEELYRAYVEGRSIYPAAPPGHSTHEYGYSFDLVTTPMDALQDLGFVWQQWGGVWGGTGFRQHDPIHFQYPGFSLAAQEPSGAGGGYESAWFPAIAKAVDFIIGFYPAIGITELIATLLSYGFPESAVLKFLSGPAEYIVGR